MSWEVASVLQFTILSHLIMTGFCTTDYRANSKTFASNLLPTFPLSVFTTEYVFIYFLWHFKAFACRSLPCWINLPAYFFYSIRKQRRYLLLDIFTSKTVLLDILYIYSTFLDWTRPLLNNRSAVILLGRS